ncbi:MAG TPA: retropepsin-like aspartic protease [Candidatus Pacearchaeota archaeon]|nr:retropepsin-like aspartic protease [Candidatus Pacearchaeota archaeon]HPR79915.1 retropepsin-like aspartic protease [Candidatus Pacearchaeota archaeon]
MNQSNALTVRSSQGRLRGIMSEIGVRLTSTSGNIQDIKDKFNGVWDTGATGSVITEKIVNALGLKPIGQKQVGTANGNMTTNTYFVDFLLPGNVLISGLEVTEGKLQGVDILVGMDVITLGDFSITNKNGNTVMSFRIPSMVEHDYIPETERYNRLQFLKEQRKPKNNATKKKRLKRKKRRH